MFRRRFGNSRKYFSRFKESNASAALTRLLCSPWLLLLFIVCSFVFMGVMLINDMNKNRPSDTDEQSNNGATGSGNLNNAVSRQPEYPVSSNKPLRIILSVATNVEPQRLYLFFSSFRRWHPESDRKNNKIYQLYVFTKFSEEKYIVEMRQMADFFSVSLVDMDPIEAQLDEQYLERFQLKMQYVKINKRRFFVLRQWLQDFTNSADIDAIFLSDANDVKFQGNIFSLYDATLEENKMSLSIDDDIFWFFMENPDVVMDGEKWNRRYIKYCFGNESIALYHDLHVSCSGTSLATLNAMRDYLDSMNQMLVEQGQLFHDCLRKPGDQALHNIVLHKELLLEKNRNVKVIRIPNDSGWVLQITTMINNVQWKDKVRELAKESVVVHQWKWARTLKADYEKEYNYAAFCGEQGWTACTISDT